MLVVDPDLPDSEMLLSTVSVPYFYYTLIPTCGYMRTLSPRGGPWDYPHRLGDPWANEGLGANPPKEFLGHAFGLTFYEAMVLGDMWYFLMVISL